MSNDANNVAQLVLMKLTTTALLPATHMFSNCLSLAVRLKLMFFFSLFCNCFRLQFIYFSTVECGLTKVGPVFCLPTVKHYENGNIIWPLFVDKFNLI